MTESRTFVCFQWNNGFRDYRPEHVNMLARAIRAKCSFSHRFVCVTEETDGFCDEVDVMPLPEEARAIASLKSIEGDRFPSSYRRLWVLSESAKCLGERVMMLDIDAAVTHDLAPLFQYTDDFVGWRPNSSWGPKWKKRIGGGTWLLRTGTHTEIWSDFIKNPMAVIKRARQAEYRGSDQAILSFYLAENCTVWPKDSGIYQAQQMKGDGFKNLPKDARIVHFNGARKPWDLKHIPWIAEAMGHVNEYVRIERRLAALEHA